jgi:hypothetical protein
MPAISQDKPETEASLTGLTDMPLLFDLADAAATVAPVPSPARTRASARSRQKATPSGVTAKQPVPDGITLREALLAYMRRHARSSVGSGTLLQVFDVDESTLDRTLHQLVAEGCIVQRTHRHGIGYRIGASDSKLPAVFQLSLFSQED